MWRSTCTLPLQRITFLINNRENKIETASTARPFASTAPRCLCLSLPPLPLEESSPSSTALYSFFLLPAPTLLRPRRALALCFLAGPRCSLLLQRPPCSTLGPPTASGRPLLCPTLSTPHFVSAPSHSAALHCFEPRPPWLSLARAELSVPAPPPTQRVSTQNLGARAQKKDKRKTAR